LRIARDECAPSVIIASSVVVATNNIFLDEKYQNVFKHTKLWDMKLVSKHCIDAQVKVAKSNRLEKQHKKTFSKDLQAK